MPGTRGQPPVRDERDGTGPRSVTVRPRTVRAGVTSFAMLAGLACYVFLAQWHVDQVLAGVLGFIFALLVRVAAASLAREWLAAHSAPPATGNGARGTRRTTKP